MDMAKPIIRFKGYQDDWEQRKLGDICKMNGRIGFRGYTEKDIITKEAGGILTFSPTNIVDNQLTIGVKNTYITREKYNESPEIMVQKGNILFVKTGSTLGKSALVTGIEEDCTVNPQVVVIKVESNLQKILSVVLTSSPVQKQIAAVKIGGAVPTMTETELKNIDLALPQNVNERIKIGEYFENFDNLITLHQRKCDETKRLKKYMLQKMFPQNGKKVPEIRFSGFTDDWEQRKFSEFVENVAVKNREGLDLECYAVTNDRGFISQKEAHDDFGYMADVDTKAYNIVPPNSFAYNPARINVGSIGYYTGTENVIVSSLYEVFQTADYVDDRFLWHWFKSEHFPKWIERLQEGSVRLYFYYDKLIQCEMKMPSLGEQKKIGAYFDSLDHLITLHQRELENLQNIKKFMLEKMFV